MSSSMRLAMMMAAGSRAGDTGIGPDLGGRVIAVLGGFPAIISRSGRRARPSGATAIGSEDNIVNSIVNNIKGRYHPKKSANYDFKKRADRLCRDRARERRHEERSQGFRQP
jgi:hypothetical protein